MTTEMKISIRAADASELPTKALLLLSSYCGPLWPDENGYVSFELSRSQFANIVAAIDEAKRGSPSMATVAPLQMEMRSPPRA
jgi:hypothetical protein